MNGISRLPAPRTSLAARNPRALTSFDGGRPELTTLRCSPCEDDRHDPAPPPRHRLRGARRPGPLRDSGARRHRGRSRVTTPRRAGAADTPPVADADDAAPELVADFDGQDASVAPGESIPVAGRIGAPTTDGVTPESGVPAAFTLELVAPDGEVLATQDVVAGDDGSFDTTVPGRATRALARQDGATTLAVRATDASYEKLRTADAGAAAVVVAGADDLQLENSFVSEVGWVKPGDDYVSRIFVRNPADSAVEDVTVTLTAPRGTSITGARSAAGSVSGAPGSTVTWTIPSVPAGSADEPSQTQLIVESAARSTAQEPTIVWRDLSTTAVLRVGGTQQGTATSHGPRVIPPGAQYDTARYGDRPFPVVPVAYYDRDYQTTNTGAELSDKINSPTLPGSTFNLFQEMSLGQLFPEGTVPSADIATAPFSGDERFTALEPSGTCKGATFAGNPVAGPGSPLYTERIQGGIYQLPGQTEYYGSDKTGSAVAGSLTGVAALADIDSGVRPDRQAGLRRRLDRGPGDRLLRLRHRQERRRRLLHGRVRRLRRQRRLAAQRRGLRLHRTPPTTTSGRTRPRWSSPTPTPRPVRAASSPTTSCATTRTGRCSTPARRARR